MFLPESHAGILLHTLVDDGSLFIYHAQRITDIGTKTRVIHAKVLNLSNPMLQWTSLRHRRLRRVVRGAIYGQIFLLSACTISIVSSETTDTLAPVRCPSWLAITLFPRYALSVGQYPQLCKTERDSCHTNLFYIADGGIPATSRNDIAMMFAFEYVRRQTPSKFLHLALKAYKSTSRPPGDRYP